MILTNFRFLINFKDFSESVLQIEFQLTLAPWSFEPEPTEIKTVSSTGSYFWTVFFNIFQHPDRPI